MSIQVYNRFVAVLAIVTLLFGLALLVPAVRRQVRAALGGGVPWLAGLVALAATSGSLIYSEVYGLEPCRLCWYQRIAMYPLSLTIGVAAWSGDRRGLRRYVLPPAVIGGLIAAYHYLIQVFPSFDTGTCSAGVPCSARYVEEFGFVSIPFMAFAAFVAIVGLVWTATTGTPEAQIVEEET